MQEQDGGRKLPLGSNPESELKKHKCYHLFFFLTESLYDRDDHLSRDLYEHVGVPLLS